MQTEAQVMQSKTVSDYVLMQYNLVRSRAGMPIVSASALTQDVILHERRMELAFEGHRWVDLLRTGKAASVMSAQLGITVDPYQLLLPIPDPEIRRAPASLTQNTGY